VRDRATVLTSVVLLVVAAAAWVSVVRSSLRGDEMMMTMPMPATITDGFAFVVGWGIMMTAMMLPSALPMISLYAAMRRGAARGGAAGGGSAGGPTAGVSVAAFTAVYLLVWAASGIPVYLAHTLLMALPGPAFAYGISMILLAAGAYQLSPLKQACLRACRSPLGFLLGHWRAGRRGSLVLGWDHAMSCLGCCWALMLVLVAAGAMGLRWVLLITAVVAAEKLLPGGEWIARGAGAAFLLLGVTMAVRPELAMVLRGAHAV
jgi:predicted metal-binding membrane protein